MARVPRDETLLLGTAHTKVVRFAARPTRAVDALHLSLAFLAQWTPPATNRTARHPCRRASFSVAVKPLSESFVVPQFLPSDEAVRRNVSSAHKNTAFLAASYG